MCEVDDGNRAEVWNETPRKARKRHRCDTCGATIAVGDRYVDHRSIFDSRVTAEKSCMPCDEARQDFGHEHGMTPLPSDIREYLSECVRGVPADMSDEDRRWVAYLSGIETRHAEAAR